MSWLDRLEDMIGSGAGAVGRGFVRSPLGQTTMGVLGAFDYPRQYLGRPFFGNVAMAGTGLDYLTASLGIGEVSPTSAAMLEEYKHGGWKNPYTAGIRGWEAMQGENDNPVVRALLDLGIDPLSYVGGSEAGFLGKAGAHAVEAGGPVVRGLGRGMQLGENILKPANAVFDIPATAGARAIRRGVSAATPDVVKRGLSYPFQYAPRARVRGEIDSIRNALGNLYQSTRTLRGQAPAADATVGRLPALSTPQTPAQQPRLSPADLLRSIVNPSMPIIRQPVTVNGSPIRGLSVDRIESLGEMRELARDGASLLFDGRLDTGSVVDRQAAVRRWRADFGDLVQRKYGVPADNTLLTSVYGWIQKHPEDLAGVADLDQVARMPHIRHAGSFPATLPDRERGGNRELADVSPLEQKNYLAAWGAGRIAYHLQGVPHGEFLAGGRYADAKAFARDAGAEGTPGLTREEFGRELESEFGLGLDPKETGRVYSDAVKAFHKQAKVASNLGGLPLNRAGHVVGRIRGKVGEDFYTRDVLPFRALFDSDDEFALALKVWSANSPQNPVGKNADQFLQQWAEHHHEINPETGENALIGLFGLTPAQAAELPRTLGIQGYMGTHRDAAARALEQGGQLRNQKTLNFAENTREAMEQAALEQGTAPSPALPAPVDEQALLQRHALESAVASSGSGTMDVWHARENFLPKNPTREQYTLMQSALHKAADEMREANLDDEVLAPLARELGMPIDRLRDEIARGEPYGLTPANLQASIWATGRARGADLALPSEGAVAASLNNPAKPGAPMATTILERLIGGGDLGKTGRSRARNSLRALGANVDQFLKDLDERGVASMGDVAGELESGRISGLSDAAMEQLAKGKFASPDALAGRGVFPGVKRNIRFEKPRPGGTGKGEKFANVDRYEGVPLVDLALDATKPPGELRNDLFAAWTRARPAYSREGSWYRSSVTGVQAGDRIHLSFNYHPEFRGEEKALAREAMDVVARHIADLRQRIGPDLDAQFEAAADLADRADEVKRAFLDWRRTTDQLVQLGKKPPETVVNALQAESPTNGATFGFVKSGARYELREVDPTRPIVGLLSTGTGAEEVRAFLRRMAPLLARSDPNDLVGGVYVSPQMRSFDLNLQAANAEEADLVASLTNQESWYDPVTGDAPPSSGGDHSGNSPLKDPDDVADFIGWVKDRRSDPTAPMPASVTRALGANAELARPSQAAGFFPGLGGLPPLGGLEQKLFGHPNLAAPDPNAVATPLTEGPGQYGDYLPDAERVLSGEELTAIRGKLEEGIYEGKTFEEAFQTGLSHLSRIRADLANKGVSWERGAEQDFGELDALKKEAKALSQAGDVLNDDPVDIVLERIALDHALAQGVDLRKSSTFDKVRGLWSQFALLSPRYHGGNFSGDVVQAMLVRGIGALPGPLEFGKTVSRMFGGSGEFFDRFDTSTVWDELAAWGARGRGSVDPKNMLTGGRASVDTAKLTRRIFGKAGIPIQKVLDANRTFADATDTTFRGAMFSDVIHSYVAEHSAELQGKILDAARKSGIDLSGQDLLPTYDPGGLYRHYKGLGMSDGLASRISRDAAELRNAAFKEGDKFVEKAFFSYKYRNIDEWVGKFVPFHYWASRALRLYTEEAFRRPALLASFVRAQEGLERAEQDPGLDGRQRGFIRLLQGPTGFTLMMNPDALFGVTKVLGLDDTTGYTPEGETGLGRVMRTLKEHGVGLYPWLDSTLNVLGTYGDTFEPDFLGIRHRAIVGAAANWLRAEGIIPGAEAGPGDAPYAEGMGEVRGAVSSWASAFLPGWMSHPVAPRAGGSIMTASLDTIIENRIIAEHPDWTEEQLLAVMLDPESPEYESAYQDASRAGIIGQMLNFTFPVGFRARENTRDVRSAQVSAIYDAAQDAGVPPRDFVPGPGDLEFAAAYRAQTGNDWKPGDYANAVTLGQLARATPESKPYVLMDAQYGQLGTPEQQATNRRYLAVLDGSVDPTGSGRAMTPDERQIVANRWLALNDPDGNLGALRAQQQLYRETHPQYDQFKTWQAQMFNLRAASGGSLAEYRNRLAEGNPNAARHFMTLIDEVTEKHPPEERADMLDRLTTDITTWWAINGVAASRQSPASLGTGGLPYDPATAMLGDYQRPSLPPQQSWLEVLAKYNRR